MSNKTETDYEVGQDNVQIMGLDIHNPVFAVSGLTILAFVFFTLVFKDQAAAFFGWLRPELTNRFDWVFMLSGNIFVIFSLMLIVTPFGSIRLGGNQHQAEDYENITRKHKHPIKAIGQLGAQPAKERGCLVFEHQCKEHKG